MRKAKPRLHLILNAHLDPVWQWRWEEGAAEALATFSQAAAILRRYPNLIFNHNEALLYRWVETYDPALFREIQRLVREGRWSVSGGWYLQPDVNLPGLESILRHIIEGQRYFWEKFRVRPRVAYNFDSFGHSGGLPQILRLAGYRMYIHMRPQPGELSLPADLYRWQGVDGSEVLVLRISVGLYHTERDNLEERLREGTELALKLSRDVPVFWGLGNHGGGATEEDVEKIDAFKRREKRVEVIHSTPDRLYEALQDERRSAPIVRGDLQRVFPGCYTSLARVKRRSEQSLAGLVQAETLRAASFWLARQEYPAETLREAWQDHLVNDFHDILTGTCIEPAEKDALDLYGKVEEMARRLRLGAAMALSQRFGKSSFISSQGIPMVVLNANPSLTSVPIEVECMLDYRPRLKGKWRLHVYDGRGNEIPSQEEQPEALLPFHDWRRKLCFWAELPGVGASFFMAQAHGAGRTRQKKVKGVVGKGPKFYLNYRFDRNNGLINWLDAGFGQSFICGPLLEPLIIEDPGDSWGTGCPSYRKVAGRFRLVPGSFRLIARGPVRTIYESVLTSGPTKIVFWTLAYFDWPVLEFRLRVHWNEERRMLKLAIPTVFRSPSVLVEVPGGAIHRSADGQEHVFGRWAVVEGKQRGQDVALALVTSGQHGLDWAEGELRLSVLRSAAYCHERGFRLAESAAWKFMDIGVHEVRLLVTAGQAGVIKKSLTALADWLSAPPFALAHLPFGECGGKGKGVRNQGEPSGESKKKLGGPESGMKIAGPLELFSVEPTSVRLTSCRMSPDQKALLLRLHETVGERTEARIRLRHPETEISLTFKPFELKTLRVEKSGRWREIGYLS
ncbi:MAG: glycoside hydrolase family 38 C-terminal domain-containing protein [Candidatus Aminicenantales bacterium]